MNISGTRRNALAARAAAVALVAALAAAPTLADEDDDEGGLEARGEATLGRHLYIIDSPYDNDSLGGFWDQYQHTNNKDSELPFLPFFIDVFHLDVGLARDDDT